ncbi:DUF1501 domain-containing protein [Humisphaera borealis]|uniref:DUF1501 domain-containing protein n=2 Tax=Humisphaera borealis TaxID=2807512 RepID=A0A7M2X4A5_9BACT|nr:DUF1501 domain-containing protein [Humisphaera borealis]
MGMGALSLAMMLASSQTAGAAGAPTAAGPLSPKQPPLKAKAKHVIHIFAAGAPSHVDTWDPKPALAQYAEKTLPGLAGVALPSPYKFSKRGQSGIEVSEVFPKLGLHVDDMTVIRSLWTDAPAHELASRFMHTGSLQLPKPSLGSWTVYGLGTENQNLPGFITLGGEPEHRQASFLPSLYQGVNVNYARNMRLDKVLLNIKNQFVTTDDQKLQLALARRLNGMHSEKLRKEDQLESRIESFEMAFKMQTEATEAFDISKETQAMRESYGETDMGAKLLVARRLVERGVRFVQVNAGGWDHHENLEVNLRKRAEDIDQPAAALLADLKKRGLLDQTLVIWGGEFGRTVTGNERAINAGRDHNGRGFCCWMAGGGVKGGNVYGATDEFGARAEQNKVHIHDLHATILALLGFDHTKLTYRYNGRDFRLTDNFGEVVKGVIA